MGHLFLVLRNASQPYGFLSNNLRSRGWVQCVFDFGALEVQVKPLVLSCHVVDSPRDFQLGRFATDLHNASKPYDNRSNNLIGRMEIRDVVLCFLLWVSQAVHLYRLIASLLPEICTCPWRCGNRLGSYNFIETTQRRIRWSCGAALSSLGGIFTRSVGTWLAVTEELGSERFGIPPPFCVSQAQGLMRSDLCYAFPIARHSLVLDMHGF